MRPLSVFANGPGYQYHDRQVTGINAALSCTVSAAGRFRSAWNGFMMTADKPVGFRIVGELGSWDVSLVDGGTLRLAAHAYSQQDGDYVFVALVEGHPHYEVELVRIPAALVVRVRGG
jgi:hypothetical protein